MKHVSKNALLGSVAIITCKGEGDDPAAVVTKALEDLTKTIDDRLKAVDTAIAAGVEAELKKLNIEKITGRLDKIEAKANRPGIKQDDDTLKEPSEERKAFGTYLRMGDRLPEEERKALTISNDEQGGYLAPPEMSSEFIRNLVEFSPMRSIASVRNIASESVKYPKRTGVSNAQWEGEAEDSDESNVTFGQTTVPASKLMTYVDLSNELLADSGGTAEAEVRMALSEDFGQKEGLAFVSGSGVKQPEGVLTHPDIGFTISGHATTITADSLITLQYALPAAYRNRGTWTMNGTTLAAVRKLKDGNGQYLWMPGLTAGQPETILGRPVVEMPDFPNVGAGLFPICFGDFDAGYRIVDRLAMSILVNPYLLATKGLTRIHATRRTGGKVINPAALRKLKISAS